MGNLLALSLQLAAFPASMDMIVIRVARVLFHFKRILGIVCNLPEECVQRQIPVAGVFIGTICFFSYNIRSVCFYYTHYFQMPREKRFSISEVSDGDH